ncbi:unnamed protein product [Lampetra fluviatilis]
MGRTGSGWAFSAYRAPNSNSAASVPTAGRCGLARASRVPAHSGVRGHAWSARVGAHDDAQWRFKAGSHGGDIRECEAQTGGVPPGTGGVPPGTGAVCHLAPAVCHLAPAVCHLAPAVCHLAPEGRRRGQPTECVCLQLACAFCLDGPEQKPPRLFPLMGQEESCARLVDVRLNNCNAAYRWNPRVDRGEVGLFGELSLRSLLPGLRMVRTAVEDVGGAVH